MSICLMCVAPLNGSPAWPYFVQISLCHKETTCLVSSSVTIRAKAEHPSAMGRIRYPVYDDRAR